MRERTTDVMENGFAAHVLVCTTDRDGDYACCADAGGDAVADAGGDAVADAVRAWLRDRGVFWSRVHVAETSCLGLCSENGTAVAIQPRNEWYSDVRPADVPDLLAAAFGPDAERVADTA